MDIKTFRAKTMQEALGLVRRELGPDAAVLHTRELNGSLMRRMLFGRKYEVAASSNVNVPSRLPARMQEQGAGSREQGAGSRIRSNNSSTLTSPTPLRTPCSIPRWPGSSTACRR